LKLNRPNKWLNYSTIGLPGGNSRKWKIGLAEAKRKAKRSIVRNVVLLSVKVFPGWELGQDQSGAAGVCASRAIGSLGLQSRVQTNLDGPTLE
jgi:hypothetical protein